MPKGLPISGIVMIISIGCLSKSGYFEESMVSVGSSIDGLLFEY